MKQGSDLFFFIFYLNKSAGEPLKWVQNEKDQTHSYITAQYFWLCGVPVTKNRRGKRQGVTNLPKLQRRPRCRTTSKSALPPHPLPLSSHPHTPFPFHHSTHTHTNQYRGKAHYPRPGPYVLPGASPTFAASSIAAPQPQFKNASTKFSSPPPALLLLVPLQPLDAFLRLQPWPGDGGRPAGMVLHHWLNFGDRDCDRGSEHAAPPGQSRPHPQRRGRCRGPPPAFPPPCPALLLLICLFLLLLLLLFLYPYGETPQAPPLWGQLDPAWL